MSRSKILAAAAALAVVASAIVATDAASADVKTFTNSIASTPQVRTVTLEITPKTLNVSLAIDGLTFVPTQFNFYLTPADTVANADATTERVFNSRNPDEPGGTWSTGGYIRGTSGPDQPGPYSGTFTLATSGSQATANLTVTEPVALPWSGPTWVAVTFYKGSTYVNAGIIEPDGLHGFGPVSDLSIPTSVPLALSAPKQTYGRTSVSMVGSVQPAAPGTVQFFDGQTLLGSQDVTEANSSFAFAVPNSLIIGAHALHAAFTPTTSRFAIGTSSELVLHVVAPPAATKVTLKLSHTTQHYKRTRVRATITVAGKHAGTVRIYDGSHRLKSLPLKKGKATYTFSSKLSKKKHTIKAVYVPKDAAAFASSTSKKLTLKVVR